MGLNTESRIITQIMLYVFRKITFGVIFLYKLHNIINVN